MDIKVHMDDNSRAFIEAKDAAVRRALEAIGMFLESEAKDELEVDPRRHDTGLLRNSVTHAIDGEGPAIASYSDDDGSQTGSYTGTVPKEDKGGAALYVGTNVEYAQYVHFGTVKMDPNAFIKNAFDRNTDQIKRKLEEELKG